MEKSVIRLFEVACREASAGWIYLRALHKAHAYYDNQVSKMQTPANKLRKYPQTDDIDVLFMLEKNTKMIHLRPLKPGDNPHACGTAFGELLLSEPLCIPLRSTWLNWWYICMLICLISLLQMSYRHIKGLTVRHNDIRASGGRLMKTWGSRGFKSYVGNLYIVCQHIQ